MKNSELLSFSFLALLSVSFAGCNKESDPMPECPYTRLTTQHATIQACDPSKGGTMLLCASLPPDTLFFAARDNGLLGTCGISYLGYYNGSPDCTGTKGNHKLYSGSKLLVDLTQHAGNANEYEKWEDFTVRFGKSIQAQILLGNCGLK